MLWVGNIFTNRITTDLLLRVRVVKTVLELETHSFSSTEKGSSVAVSKEGNADILQGYEKIHDY